MPTIYLTNLSDSALESILIACHRHASAGRFFADLAAGIAREQDRRESLATGRPLEVLPALDLIDLPLRDLIRGAAFLLISANQSDRQELVAWYERAGLDSLKVASARAELVDDQRETRELHQARIRAELERGECDDEWESF